MTEDDPLGPLDPEFAAQFRRDDRRPPCQLYLISPLDVAGGFADRLARALDAGPVAAFQFRVKDIDQHAAAKLAEPLQRLCADREVAFIVNDSISLAKRLCADGVSSGSGRWRSAEARDALGPNVQIGVTCHDSRHLAMEAGGAARTMSPSAPSIRPRPRAVKHVPEPSILSWCVDVRTAERRDRRHHAGQRRAAGGGRRGLPSPCPARCGTATRPPLSPHSRRC